MIFKLFKKNKRNTKRICSDCETGAKSFQLDKREWMCPYSISCTGDKCAYYQKMNNVQTERIKKKDWFLKD